MISGQNKPCDNWLFFDGLSGMRGRLVCMASWHFPFNHMRFGNVPTGAAVMQRLTLEEKAKVEIPDAELIDDLLSDSD